MNIVLIYPHLKFNMIMDCLVTKLKSSVNDENLPYFNKIKIKGTDSDSTISITNGGKIKITSDVNSAIMFGQTRHELPYETSTGSVSVKAVSGEVLDIYISGDIKTIATNCIIEGNNLSLAQFNLTSINVYGINFNTELLRYNSSVTSLTVSGTGKLEGYFSDLEETALNKINITTGNECRGNIAYLAKDDITYISMPNSAYAYGNIEDFGNCLNLTDLYLTNSKDVYGDINKLATIQYQNGRETGSLKVLVNNTQCSNSEGSGLRVTINFSNSGPNIVSE